jgi:hypothetical protein
MESRDQRKRKLMPRIITRRMRADFSAGMERESLDFDAGRRCAARLLTARRPDDRSSNNARFSGCRRRGPRRRSPWVPELPPAPAWQFG